MSDYPEHDKLTKVAPESQAQGELLEWLSSQGIHLMVRWEGEEPDDCTSCWHGSDASRDRCTTTQRCHACKGTHQVMRYRAAWVPDHRSIPDLLATYHGIDQRKLEQEKRAMLAAIRGEAH